jgi:biotin synthase
LDHLKVREISDAAMKRPITVDEALALAHAPGEDAFWALLDGADRLRRMHRGNAVSLCAIVNAKSGRCGEDCAFCAQSAHYQTDVEEYPFLGEEKILDAASEAAAMGAREFSMVVSGRSIRNNELTEAAGIIPKIAARTGMVPCASLGVLDQPNLEQLRDAGLSMMHHNLETSRTHYPDVCTTRPYDANRDLVARAKRAGFFVCSGGIFGMGETWEQRVEMFLDLRELDVDSVPINFLNPRPGTPMENAARLAPKECLRIIALARHILPTKQIVICGGRDVNLRDLQPLVFHAGASGLMIGNYLTTRGRDWRQDRQMIEDLGLPIVPKPGAPK